MKKLFLYAKLKIKFTSRLNVSIWSSRKSHSYMKLYFDSVVSQSWTFYSFLFLRLIRRNIHKTNLAILCKKRRKKYFVEVLLLLSLFLENIIWRKISISHFQFSCCDVINRYESALQYAKKLRTFRQPQLLKYFH